MDSIEHIVIIGAGLAGVHAAATLRNRGFDGTITLLGEDPERPYNRPPLSKSYLVGKRERDGLDVNPAAFYAEQRIDLRPGISVVAIQPATLEVVLGTGERLRADRILLATGSAPRRLGIPGEDLPGVQALRTLADADALKAALIRGDRVVVVGAGWIGGEVASSLRSLGHDVTVLEFRSSPLEMVVGPIVGGVLGVLHRDHGVDLRLGAGVTRILGTDRVTGVEVNASETIAAACVVMAVGVAPRTELGRDAGLAAGDGIRVNAELETSIPGVFAAGDVAAYWNPFYQQRIRTEHSSNARNQGQAAAAAMLGEGVPFDAIPSFSSEQHGLRIEVIGHAATSDVEVIRGSLEARMFVAFRLDQDGRVLSGTAVGVPDTGKVIERLIRSRAVVDPARLADTDVPIEVLAAG